MYPNRLTFLPPVSGERAGGGKEPLPPSPLIALVKQEFRATESIMRSKEDTAGWPLSKVQLLDLLREYSLGTVPSVSKKPGGGLISRTCRFWVMDFVNASRGFSADLLGLSQAARILLFLHTGQSAAPLDRPPASWPLGACVSMS